MNMLCRGNWKSAEIYLNNDAQQVLAENTMKLSNRRLFSSLKILRFYAVVLKCAGSYSRVFTVPLSLKGYDNRVLL